MVQATTVRGETGAEGDEQRERLLEGLGVVDAGPEERFDRITRLAQQLFGVANASVTLIGRDRQYFKSQHGAVFEDGPREEAFCDHTIRLPETMVVEDASADARFATNPLVTGEEHVRFYAGHPLEAPGGQRVGALCLLDDHPRQFTPAERALLAELADWVQGELTRSAELEQAAEVQQRLLPREAPLLPGYEVAGACVPSLGVGGDFFDWYPAPGGELVLTVADVMGKGIPAAIIAATVRATMRSTGRTAGPGSALGQAAAILEGDLEETGTLVTLCHARLAPSEGVLRYSDAGHGLVVLVGADGVLRRPRGGGLPLGVLRGQQWAERTVVLAPGDTVVAFSDGVLDLYDGTMESLERIAEVVRASPSASDVVDGIIARTRRAGLLQDDVTVVAIRRSR